MIVQTGTSNIRSPSGTIIVAYLFDDPTAYHLLTPPPGFDFAAWRDDPRRKEARRILGIRRVEVVQVSPEKTGRRSLVKRT